MNNLLKEKRDSLILVGAGTLVVLALIIFALIRPQYATISDTKAKINDARSTLQSREDTIKKADTISAQLSDLTYKIARAENDVATGDPSQWIYDTIRNFKEHYNISISVNGQLSMGTVELLPTFPYKQLKVSVGGTAYYHDLGKFIADFENAYPHAQITNLILEPAGNASDSSEKLAFRMDIIVLANPTGPQS
jgi:Tfp pilus assembly protein PilO